MADLLPDLLRDTSAIRGFPSTRAPAGSSVHAQPHQLQQPRAPGPQHQTIALMPHLGGGDLRGRYVFHAGRSIDEPVPDSSSKRVDINPARMNRIDDYAMAPLEVVARDRCPMPPLIYRFPR